MFENLPRVVTSATGTMSRRDWKHAWAAWITQESTRGGVREIMLPSVCRRFSAGEEGCC